MFNIGYFKGLPTECILKYGSGKLRREGQGLAFFFARHSTQIVSVPTVSQDAAFVFNEATSTFQSVAIQGQLTYRVHDPKRAATLLNFTIDPATRRYLSEDPDRLSQRIVNIVQMETRAALAGLSLEEALTRFESVAASAQRRVKDGGLLEPLGVELLSVYFQSVRPTPEVAKALEAGYRETLLRKADEAIFARRAAAVEEERKIKENELATDVALEEQKEALIARQGENRKQRAELRGQAIETEAAYKARAREMELAVFQKLEPRAVLALAMEEMGRNAQKVGNLTITSEMLASLLNGHDTQGR